MSDTVYSISRLDCINRCTFEAYRTYVVGERGANNIYTVLGSTIHECLENIVKGEATEKDLLPAMEKDLENVTLFGLEFPKDMKSEDSIRTNWIDDMTHFCKSYVSPKRKKLKAEELVTYTTPKGYKLQGYIDLIWEQANNIVGVYDYKTSAMYNKEGMKEHGRQLVLYGLALEAQGYTVRSINWIFTKYVDVTYEGYKTVKSKSKTEITKSIERRKITKELEAPIIQDLKELGLDDIDIELKLDDFKNTGIIPEEVRNNYKIRPCVVEYEFSDNTKAECIDYIENTIESWEALSEEDKSNMHREFTRTQKNGKVVNDIYYCSCLCPHKANCPYFNDFMVQLNTSDNSDIEDLF